MKLVADPTRQATAHAAHYRGVAQMHRSGGDPDRILIVGDDFSLGWGRTEELGSLPGRLADRLSLETRRGLDLDLLVGRDVSIDAAAALVGERRLWRYDAIVLAFDPARSWLPTRANAWRRSLATLLDVLERDSAMTARLVVLGVDAGHNGSGSTRLNRIGAELCAARDRATFLTLNPAAIPNGDVNVGWARAVTNALLPALGAQAARVDGSMATSARYLRDQPDRETDRMRALTQAAILDTAPEGRFDLIVAEARRLFGTESAEINFVDHDRQWTKAAAGSDGGQGARQYSFCSLTIQRSAGMVVPDARQDDRLRDNPLVTGEHPIRFYAGFPIESIDGYRIGALCVYDSNPRDTADLDVVALRDLALLAQEELRRRTIDIALPATHRLVPEGARS